MGIEDIFAWYQQKIGTYDKQQWETRLEQREQRILYGLQHVQKRSTKPNTGLIDLDLVRGSSFTKAKPQHGFITVAKLATLRCIFLPFYSKWWLQQTSGVTFIFILILYFTQIVNMVVYYVYTTNNSSEPPNCMDVLIPLTIMWVLSLVLSQIVATSPGTERKIGEVKSRQQYRHRRSHVREQHRLEKHNDESRKRLEKVDKSKCVKSTSGDDVLNVDKKESAIAKNYNRSYMRVIRKGINIDDDGFESLNGNGSWTSDEETVPRTSQIANATEDENEVSQKESQKSNIEEDSDSERSCNSFYRRKKKRLMALPKIASKATRPANVRRNSHILAATLNSDSEDEVLSSTEAGRQPCPLLGDATSSATEWMGVTTNSEDFSSDIEDDLAPAAILSPPSVKVSCIIWERNEIKKADLSVLDISSAIIGKVDSMPKSMDYFYVGIIMSMVLTFLPLTCILSYCHTGNCEVQFSTIFDNVTMTFFVFDTKSSVRNICKYMSEELPALLKNIFDFTMGLSLWKSMFVVTGTIQRWILACMVFFLLSVAERTFKQRLLYAKLFSHLTSSRRARKSELPHFRLNKVRNIKTWLSVRSYLKKRGPQRSVDVIVSTAFVISLLLLTFICIELLKETATFSQYYFEALIWCLGLGIFLLRFMTLGTKINQKYRNLSVLITEQINLHLQIEQKPHKKDELSLANNVLKLAIDLLKELENPFKISGLSANPILYNVTKLVILSALSGVLSEMLGFKLKLHKIKLT